MTDLINNHKLNVNSELLQHQYAQRIEELEFDQKTLSKLQQIAKVGVWKLNHLSYDVYLSDELITLLALHISHNQISWEAFVNLLDPTGGNNMHTILMEQMILGGKKRSFEHCHFKHDGSCSFIKHFCETFRNAIGQPMITVGLTQDITEERHQTLLLQKLSVTDELTGLYNRRKLNESLYELMGDVVDFSVILVDMDLFKSINDAYGHLAGDEVLIATAKILNQTCKGQFTCGRWGGEEFLIICPHITLENAAKLADTLRLKIQSMVLSFSHTTTASFGVAARKYNDTPDTLMVRCDNRLYIAKSQGRNTVCYLEPNASAK